MDGNETPSIWTISTWQMSIISAINLLVQLIKFKFKLFISQSSDRLALILVKIVLEVLAVNISSGSRRAGTCTFLGLTEDGLKFVTLFVVAMPRDVFD